MLDNEQFHQSSIRFFQLKRRATDGLAALTVTDVDRRRASPSSDRRGPSRPQLHCCLEQRPTTMFTPYSDRPPRSPCTLVDCLLADYVWLSYLIFSHGALRMRGAGRPSTRPQLAILLWLCPSLSLITTPDRFFAIQRPYHYFDQSEDDGERACFDRLFVPFLSMALLCGYWISTVAFLGPAVRGRTVRRSPSRRILYGLYLPTVILTVIWYSITHSLFLSRLKTFLLYKSFPL